MVDANNDNAASAVPIGEPDAHGQAAIFLVESLIHGLVERKVISVADAVEIVEVAIEVNQDGASDNGSTPPTTTRRSIGLMVPIADSLRTDLGRLR